MELDDFIRAVKGDLAQVLDRSGRVLYSSVDTLKPGDLYLLGLNPGPDRDGIDGRDIAENLERLPRESTNCYLDGCWDPGRPGQDKLQRRVVWLLDSLGYDPRGICASNLIFMRSAGEHDCGYPQSADICWPVHRRILSIVKPKMILCFGGLPFEYLLHLPGGVAAVETFPSGHFTWQCRAALKQVAGRWVAIVSVPHLSRYDIIGKLSVVGWIQQRMGARINSGEEAQLPLGEDVTTKSDSGELTQVISSSVQPAKRSRQDSSDIPYESRMYRTNQPYLGRGKREIIWKCWNDGCTVAEFVARARAAVGGGPEDVRIYWYRGVIRLDPPPQPGQIRKPRLPGDN
jgi:hypothetical protein